MANELAYEFGFPITLQFELANPNANTTTDMDFGGDGGAGGFVVPAGYAFHPMLLSVDSNADLTAGTLTAKVIDNGTELVHGPAPALSDEVQHAAAVQRIGPQPIAAGHVVGVSVTTTSGYLPITADIVAVLAGVLLPA